MKKIFFILILIPAFGFSQKDIRFDTLTKYIGHYKHSECEYYTEADSNFKYLNVGSTTGTACYGRRDSGETQWKSYGGSWMPIMINLTPDTVYSRIFIYDNNKNYKLGDTVFTRSRDTVYGKVVSRISSMIQYPSHGMRKSKLLWTEEWLSWDDRTTQIIDFKKIIEEYYKKKQ